MKNSLSKNRFVLLYAGILIVCFSMGGLAHGQQTQPEGPTSGIDSPPDQGGIIAPPKIARDLVKIAWISPREYLAIHNPFLFGLRDFEVAELHLNLQFAFKIFFGAWFQVPSINGCDVQVDLASGDLLKFFFTMRHDQFLVDKQGEPFFLRRNEIASMGVLNGDFELYFSGHDINMPDIDAFWITICGDVIFSTAADWYYNVDPLNPIFFYEQDLAKYDCNTGEFSVYLRGMDIGINTLDGADRQFLSKYLYFSVRKPQWVFNPYGNIFLRDGDIARLDTNTGEITYFINGYPWFIYSIDALAVFKFPPKM